MLASMSESAIMIVGYSITHAFHIIHLNIFARVLYNYSLQYLLMSMEANSIVIGLLRFENEMNE